MTRTKPKPRQKKTGIILIIAIAFGVAVVLVAGFALSRGNRPSAPALRAEPVYQNTREGFRFVAPEGWALIAKADLPSGPVDSEHMLVRYQAVVDKPAAFEVTLIDLPESSDLTQFFAPSFGVSSWQPVGSPEPLKNLPLNATRYDFRSDSKAKEIVVFRRKGRVYFFTVTFTAGDDKSRSVGRTVVESIVWTK